MLAITITPNALYFKSLSDELYAEIKEKFDLDIVFLEGKPRIWGEPDKLYKVLYLLSTAYDIEIY